MNTPPNHPSGKEARSRLGIRLAVLVATICLPFALSGCAAERLYATGQAYQSNQCQRIRDQVEREQCLSKAAGMSYEEYRRERDAMSN